MIRCKIDETDPERYFYRKLFEEYKARKEPEIGKTIKSKGHLNNMAKRYIEKRLLRDIWYAWVKRYGIEGVNDDEYNDIITYWDN